MWLIGREWKYSDVRSGPVLIDRGLDLSREPHLKEPEGDAQMCVNRLLRISGEKEDWKQSDRENEDSEQSSE